MKVLFLTYNDYGAAGGTSTATFRLYGSLKKRSIESQILCRVKRLAGEDSFEIPRSRIGERLIRELTSRLGFNDLHGVSSFRIHTHPLFQAADVLHLHSFHSGYFNSFAITPSNEGKTNKEVTEASGIETLHFGFIENERLQAALYSSADLFVFSSREETFALTVSESMAGGTPVAAFDIGPVLERVIEGVTGVLGEAGNPESLSQAIVRILEDDLLRKKMSSNARALIVNGFSLEQQTRKYLELYENLLHPNENVQAA